MSALASNTVGLLHNKLVFRRRVDVLSNWLARLAPQGSHLLDVGCGDGLISATLQSKRPDLSIRGIDVLARHRSHIPVEIFDGRHIPCEDASFDLVLFSDVLHHTQDPTVLLREARRVANHGVLIKDHFRKGLAAGSRLRFMDWVGNARFEIAPPYAYWTESQWRDAWRRIGFQPTELVTRLGLYAAPANWIFGAQLHFIALLTHCPPS